MTNLKTWEGIMERTYAWWRAQEIDGRQPYNWCEFVDEQDALDALAIRIGKFNQQVLNGGFVQWIDNGYAVCWKDLITDLRRVGTSATLEAANIIQDARDTIMLEDGTLNEYEVDEWGEDDDDDFYGYDSYLDYDDATADILDARYSDIYEQLERDVAAYIEDQQPVVSWWVY